MTPLVQPPPTVRQNVVETLHGTLVTDPYRWLEDQDSPDTRAWLDEQIAYTHQVLAGYHGREAIRDRLAELMKVDSTTLPVCRGDTYFFSRRRSNEQQYIIYRRQGLDGPDDPLIDPHPMSPDSTTSVSLYDVSHDGGLIAYGIRQGGADEVEIRLRSTSALIDLPDILPVGRYYGIGISNDNSKLYYSVSTPDGPRVRVHKVGESVDEDIELFGAGLGPEKIVSAALSEDGKYLLIGVYYGSAGDKTELHIADLSAGTPVRPIIDNLPARFYAQAAGDFLYLHSNWNAPNGRLFRLSVNAATNSPNDWQEVVPTKAEAVLLGFSPIGGKLFLNYLENVSSRITITDSTGRAQGELPLPGIGTVSGPYGKWNSTEMFYSFNSFAVPTTAFRSDSEAGGPEIWARTDTPIDSEAIEVQQVTYSSKDGAQVPMFLVYAKGMEADGARPIYLTGYGGFTVSRTPAFAALAALWAERGGIFALPNLRGGGEFGEEWHRDGMLAKKQNVFDDFYAAAQWLIDSGYTRSDKIAIAGRSNGGLLVGAAITQRPELFGAAVCGYPLLDMIRYQKFLVAGFWVPEYGSSENANQFDYLYAYSPYHHVANGVKYPAVMLVTGDSDTRVAPLHARKMAAMLQANTGSGKPVLLHYDITSGHSEGKPVNQMVEDTADEILFLSANLGL